MKCECCGGKIYFSYFEGIHPCGKKVIFCGAECAKKHNKEYMENNCSNCPHVENMELIYD